MRAAHNARELAFSGIVCPECRRYQLKVIPWTKVALLDFSGKPRKRGAPPTLEMCLEPFLADLAHLERLRPHTLRAYRYELVAAAADPRFRRPLSELDQVDLEAWLVRGNQHRRST